MRSVNMVSLVIEKILFSSSLWFTVSYAAGAAGEDVCCSVVLGTLVGVYVFSVMWFELLMISAISCPL